MKKAFTIKFHLKEGQEIPFREASMVNREASQKEKGNISYEILQDPVNNREFLFFEIYEDDDAVNVHKSSDHFKKWKEETGDLISKSEYTYWNPVES